MPLLLVDFEERINKSLIEIQKIKNKRDLNVYKEIKSIIESQRKKTLPFTESVTLSGASIYKIITVIKKAEEFEIASDKIEKLSISPEYQAMLYGMLKDLYDEDTDINLLIDLHTIIVSGSQRVFIKAVNDGDFLKTLAPAIKLANSKNFTLPDNSNLATMSEKQLDYFISFLEKYSSIINEKLFDHLCDPQMIKLLTSLGRKKIIINVADIGILIKNFQQIKAIRTAISLIEKDHIIANRTVFYAPGVIAKIIQHSQQTESSLLHDKNYLNVIFKFPIKILTSISNQLIDYDDALIAYKDYLEQTGQQFVHIDISVFNPHLDRLQSLRHCFNLLASMKLKIEFSQIIEFHQLLELLQTQDILSQFKNPETITAILSQPKETIDMLTLSFRSLVKNISDYDKALTAYKEYLDQTGQQFIKADISFFNDHVADLKSLRHSFNLLAKMKMKMELKQITEFHYLLELLETQQELKQFKNPEIVTTILSQPKETIAKITNVFRSQFESLQYSFNLLVKLKITMDFNQFIECHQLLALLETQEKLKQFKNPKVTNTILSQPKEMIAKITDVFRHLVNNEDFVDQQFSIDSVIICLTARSSKMFGFKNGISMCQAIDKINQYAIAVASDPQNPQHITPELLKLIKFTQVPFILTATELLMRERIEINLKSLITEPISTLQAENLTRKINVFIQVAKKRTTAFENKNCTFLNTYHTIGMKEKARNIKAAIGRLESYRQTPECQLKNLTDALNWKPANSKELSLKEALEQRRFIFKSDSVNKVIQATENEYAKVEITARSLFNASF